MSASPAPAAAPASTIAADVVAGLSIAGLLLPEAVAYSGIAGLPPQAGVIGLLAGLVCYGLLGRSRYAIVSATSSSAAVLAAGMLALAAPEGAARAAVAATLVLLTGACFLIAGIARLGGLSQMIARPVLRGFTFGLAGVIALKQLPHLLGLPELHGDFVPSMLAHLLTLLDRIQPVTMSAGVIALLLLFASERLRYVPGSGLAIVLGIAASGWLQQRGVMLTGTIDLTLAWVLPIWPSSGQWLPSVELAAALLLILYAESVLALACQRVAAHPARRMVVLSLEESADLDSTALEALADFAAWLSARDVTLRVARLKDVVRQLLQRAALPQLPASELDFWSVEDAAGASATPPSTRGSGQ